MTAGGDPRPARSRSRRRKERARWFASAIPSRDRRPGRRGEGAHRDCQRRARRCRDRAPDGTPTYNFCVVVDDLDMRITHVIRATTTSTIRRGKSTLSVRWRRRADLRAPADGADSRRREPLRATALPRASWNHGDGLSAGGLVNYLARLAGRMATKKYSRVSNSSSGRSRGAIVVSRTLRPRQACGSTTSIWKRLPEAELGDRLRPFLERAGLDPRPGPIRRGRRSASRPGRSPGSADPTSHGTSMPRRKRRRSRSLSM